MYRLTAADFADTGQWRLLLKIGNTGLEAFLENTLHPEIEPQPLCSEKWGLNKDMLRENIEEAVYKNPRLLDDFATRITLYDTRTMFIPTEIAEKEAGAEEDIYSEVYSATSSDIMSDTDRDITAVWSMAPGVKSFLMRTFPGAKISSNLMELVKRFRKEAKGLSLFVIARKEEADLIFLDGHDLISASSHEWKIPDDVAYLVMNLIDIYKYKFKDIALNVKDLDIDSDAWKFLKSKSRSFNVLTN